MSVSAKQSHRIGHLRRDCFGLGPRNDGIFMFLLFLCSITSADERAYQKILSQPSRPRIAEVKTIREDLEKRAHGIGSLTSRVLDHFPKGVVFMEMAYPGAIWAFLGRDSAFIGDAVDAFYESIGQPGRVVRLNASGDGVRGASEEMRFAMLESAGLNLKEVETGRPFIIIDYTQFKPKSQSALLLNAAYLTVKKSGGDLSQIIRKLSAMKMGTGNQPEGGLEDVFRKQKEDVDMRGIPYNVLEIPGVTSAGSFLEWHSYFGPIEKQPNGKVEGKLGALSNESLRAEILSQMYEAIQAAENPVFLERVRWEAKHLGYEFPMGTCREALILEGKGDR